MVTGSGIYWIPGLKGDVGQMEKRLQDSVSVMDTRLQDPGFTGARIHRFGAPGSGGGTSIGENDIQLII